MAYIGAPRTRETQGLFRRMLRYGSLGQVTVAPRQARNVVFVEKTKNVSAPSYRSAGLRPLYTVRPFPLPAVQ